jgi:hypothetical protein
MCASQCLHVRCFAKQECVVVTGSTQRVHDSQLTATATVPLLSLFHNSQIWMFGCNTKLWTRKTGLRIMFTNNITR